MHLDSGKLSARPAVSGEAEPVLDLGGCEAAQSLVRVDGVLQGSEAQVEDERVLPLRIRE